jgi:UDP-glucose 4-epimerase
MRIVVTGGSGNIGTATLRRLARDGDRELVGVARRIPENPTALPDVEWMSADLTDDRCLDSLGAGFAGADAVVHLAWGFQPSHDQRYLEELAVGGTRRVLRAVTRARVPHLVHMSSIGAYSPKKDDSPVDESWPTGGVPSSAYSRHKAAAERLLDDHERADHDTVITRLRPGIVGQRSAGSALLRYGVPGLVPAAVLDHVRLLPLDRRLEVPMVHADDVADAIALAVDQRPGGAFNLAADPPITTQRIADALGARVIHVPSSVLRALMSAAWHARLQQADTGWLDLAFALPLLDSSRARHELGWSPSHDATSVLGEVLAGMRHRDSGGTPILRPRSVLSALGDLVTHGPVARRHRP